MHDEAIVGGRKALAAMTGTHLRTPWKLLVAENGVMTAPRTVVIADTFTHPAHHRGQSTVYRRVQGKRVPSECGPSADAARSGESRRGAMTVEVS
jgi:uncharacterized damage-inducible protein DinB